jgi:hypothetical protein
MDRGDVARIGTGTAFFHPRSSALIRGQTSLEKKPYSNPPKYLPEAAQHHHQFFDPLTEQVLGAIFEVSNTLGTGFLEKVYERALLKELTLRGIRATSQTSIPGPIKANA